MLNIQKQRGKRRNLNGEKHEFSIIFQWLQSLQIYPLCGCKDTHKIQIGKKKKLFLPTKGHILPLHLPNCLPFVCRSFAVQATANGPSIGKNR
jgi:hypothetical protein